jgi:hypothetical protein
MLVLYEILLLETTGGVLRRTMPDLCLRTNCRNIRRHLILITRVFLQRAKQKLIGSTLPPAQRMTTKISYVRNANGQFVCPECGETKDRQNTMFYHMKKHSGITSYKCKEAGCQKGFIQKSGLQQHMAQAHPNTIDDSNPYTKQTWSCPSCPHTCRMKANMTIHIARKHMKEIPPYSDSCSGCNKHFASATAYYYHALSCLTNSSLEPILMT